MMDTKRSSIGSRARCFVPTPRPNPNFSFLPNDSIEILHRAAAYLCLLVALIGGFASSARGSELVVQTVTPITSRMVLPDTPVTDEEEAVLNVVGCRGEAEPASFLMRSLGRPLRKATLEATDLVNGGRVIPASRIDIRTVKVWYQASGAWKTHWRRNTKDRLLVPELLLHDDDLVHVDLQKKANLIKLQLPNGFQYVSISSPELSPAKVIKSISEFPVRDAPKLQPIDLGESKTLQIWLTVSIPPTAPSGTYRGSLAIAAEGKTLRKLPLLRTGSSLSASGTQIDVQHLLSGHTSPEPRKRFFRIQECGTAHGRTPRHAEPRHRQSHSISKNGTTPAVGRIPGNTAELRFEFPTFVLSRSANRDAQDLRSPCQIEEGCFSMNRIAKRFGIDEVYYYGVDEARGAKLRAEQPAWHVVHEAGGRIFAAGNEGHYEITGPSTDLLVFQGKPDPQMAVTAHRLNSKIFSYANPQVAAENPFIYRLNYGFTLWQARFDGVMDYAYQHSSGFIWNDFDNERKRDMVFAYPTADGVIDTIAWEGFREAVDDMRYLASLEEAITHQEESNKPASHWIAEAEDYINALRRRKITDPSQIRAEIVALLLRSPST